jgi:GTP-binding protein HflX
LRFPEERELILTDTVGFIRSLPKELIEAFRATLEELEEADLLLHVIDAASEEREQQIRAVDHILESLNLQNTPRLLVYNKIDLLSPGQKEWLLNGAGEDGNSVQHRSVYVSALSGEGLSALSREMISMVRCNTTKSTHKTAYQSPG